MLALLREPTWTRTLVVCASVILSRHETSSPDRHGSGLATGGIDGLDYETET